MVMVIVMVFREGIWSADHEASRNMANHVVSGGRDGQPGLGKDGPASFLMLGSCPPTVTRRVEMECGGWMVGRGRMVLVRRRVLLASPASAGGWMAESRYLEAGTVVLQ